MYAYFHSFSVSFLWLLNYHLTKCLASSWPSYKIALLFQPAVWLCLNMNGFFNARVFPYDYDYNKSSIFDLRKFEGHCIYLRRTIVALFFQRFLFILRNQLQQFWFGKSIHFCQCTFFQCVLEHQLPLNKLLIEAATFSEQYRLY